MEELINGRTPEEIKHVAEWNCYSCGGLECDDCSYLDACTIENRDRAVPDALALIERLESERDAALAKVPRWISVEDRLPMEDQLVLVYLGGYIGSLMELCSLDEFGGWVTDMRIAEDAPITHWMPLPLPPKEGE